MAQPKRLREHTLQWRFVGQSKVHTLRYWQAADPDHSTLAEERNDFAADELELYRGACETGTAIVVSHETAVT